jgi:hypothetical protein
MKMISIVKHFSENPGGRYRTDGPNSGERFRDEVLVPALRLGEKIEVDLDGALGFGSSFLEEAFGGLVREAGYKPAELLRRIIIKSAVPTYKNRIYRYIEEGEQKPRRTRFGL